ncbi:lytic murein transglycosylase [Sphaerisporangium fuscum]|uniref:lytic murein transglycosylase n=1 Tax=Sphaerisporangium fuscum TaxID=2835868 RepID=UPI0027E2515C|nr:lytic murein transglycosylase [Sphaerisporangium fuscum]
MSQRPRLAPTRAAVAGLALVIVLGVAVGGTLLITRAAADDPGGAARTPLAEVRDLTSKVTPFPALTPGASQPPGQQSAQPPQGSPSPTAPPLAQATAEGQVVLATPPRLIAVTRQSVSQDTLLKVAALKDVTKVTLADGGAVRFSAATLNLLAVDPMEFRTWAPKAVAEEPAVWDALARGEFVAESATAGRYMLQLGGEYDAGTGSRLRVAASAPFGLPGVDGLVSREVGRALGLVPGVAVLVHTPRAKASDVGARVKRLLGKGAQIITIGANRVTRPPVPVPSASPTAAPVPVAARERSGTSLVGRPGSYLDLYKISAGVCPGLSWTVLAAIGQVESGHGRNNGPSSAGALGPMQFMPATWKAYGVDGDGDGKADIWSPYDAVPSAAHYLCANGGGQGGAKLRSAVFRYNHSWDYVNRVLGIAEAYARAYP